MRDGVRIALDVMLPPPERYDLSAGVPCVLIQTRVRVGRCAGSIDHRPSSAQNGGPTAHLARRMISICTTQVANFALCHRSAPLQLASHAANGHDCCCLHVTQVVTLPERLHL